MTTDAQHGETDAVSAAAAAKEQHLLARLAELPAALVAYSGGVDSTYLLWAARRALGEKAAAVLGVSDSLAGAEYEAALAAAQRLGVTVRRLATAELEDARYLANPSNRCYFCKTELYGRLAALAREEAGTAVLDGTNADDLRDHRPGRQAALEYGVLSPLVEAGLGKAEIRVLARRAGLAAWDKPAEPCLSSRVPYGQSISSEKLSRIGRAEAWLKAHGFPVVRVRHDGDEARVEVPLADVPRLAEDALRGELERALCALGFARVTVDPRGYRSGSLNEALRGGPRPARTPEEVAEWK